MYSFRTSCEQTESINRPSISNRQAFMGGKPVFVLSVVGILTGEFEVYRRLIERDS